MDIIWRDTSSSATYEEARLVRVFNARRPKSQPTAIVRAKTESDIVEAVKLAREKGLRVTVLGGGHSFPVWSLRDDSILIDLGDYSEFRVNADAKEAWVSSGLRSNVDQELMEKYGLMLGAGHHPGVGLGGYLLQGGLSWNCRNRGWACERIKALDVVTANGRLVHCTSEENSDLFWAAQGSGPIFPGIVTRFHVQLLPAPKIFRSSTYVFGKQQYHEAFNWVLGILPTFDEDTEIVAVCRYPEGIHELCFTVCFITMKEDLEAARKALLPAHGTRPEGAIQELFCQEDSLEQEYANEISGYPEDRRWFADNAFINNDVDIAALLEDICMSLPDRRFIVLWYPLFPQSRRNLPDMAFSVQSDHYVGIYAIYDSDDNDEQCSSWLRSTMAKIEPFSRGSFTGETDFQFRKGKYWGDDQLKRLTRIRQKWDPDGRICAPLGHEDLDIKV